MQSYSFFLYEQKTYSQLFLFHSPFRNKANCGEYRIVDVFHCILLIARNVLIINTNWDDKMTKYTPCIITIAMGIYNIEATHANRRKMNIVCTCIYARSYRGTLG